MWKDTLPNVYFDEGINTFITRWFSPLHPFTVYFLKRKDSPTEDYEKLTFLDTKILSCSSGQLELRKPQRFPQTTTPKCLSNVLECWIVLDLLQRLLKPVPITVSFVGLFCSVDTCRP